MSIDKLIEERAKAKEERRKVLNESGEGYDICYYAFRGLCDDTKDKRIFNKYCLGRYNSCYIFRQTNSLINFWKGINESLRVFKEKGYIEEDKVI